MNDFVAQGFYDEIEKQAGSGGFKRLMRVAESQRKAALKGGSPAGWGAHSDTMTKLQQRRIRSQGRLQSRAHGQLQRPKQKPKQKLEADKYGRVHATGPGAKKPRSFFQ